MKSVIALTLAVFCLSMDFVTKQLIDFGDCRRHHNKLHKEIKELEEMSGLEASTFELMASGIIGSLEMLVKEARTANGVAKFMIDILTVLMNVGVL